MTITVREAPPASKIGISLMPVFDPPVEIDIAGDTVGCGRVYRSGLSMFTSKVPAGKYRVTHISHDHEFCHMVGNLKGKVTHWNVPTADLGPDIAGLIEG